jgi:hypothetical protein
MSPVTYEATPSHRSPYPMQCRVHRCVCVCRVHVPEYMYAWLQVNKYVHFVIVISPNNNTTRGACDTISHLHSEWPHRCLRLHLHDSVRGDRECKQHSRAVSAAPSGPAPPYHTHTYTYQSASFSHPAILSLCPLSCQLPGSCFTLSFQTLLMPGP